MKFHLQPKYTRQSKCILHCLRHPRQHTDAGNPSADIALQKKIKQFVCIEMHTVQFFKMQKNEKAFFDAVS